MGYTMVSFTFMTLWVTQWSHSLLWHCELHNGLTYFIKHCELHNGFSYLSDIVCDYNGLSYFQTLYVITMVSLIFRHCMWLQWSLHSFITVCYIISYDSETFYNLSISIDYLTPRELMFSEHFSTTIDTNYIKDYLYTLDFLSTIYT